MSRFGLYALWLTLALSPVALWGGNRALAEIGPLAQPGLFDPSSAMPAVGSTEAAVLSLARAGQRVAACQRAVDALRRATEPTASRLRWHIGHQCDDATVANAALSALASANHPLSMWARLDQAERLRGSEPLRALLLLPADDGAWAGRDRARVTRALALVAVADPAAEAALRALVAEASDESGAATVAMPLAGLLRTRDTVESKLEALTLYRRVATRAPLTAVGRLALSESTRLLPTLPEPLQQAHALTPVADEQHRGRALFNAHQVVESAAVFASIAERAGDDLTLACSARVSQLRALSRTRDRRAELVALSDQVVNRCSDAETRAWSHYYAAQALARLGDPAAAIARFDRIAVDAPGHSLVDDALFKSAQSALDLGDAAGSDARLRAVVTQHPQGDMNALARFELAWRLRLAGDHAAALSELEQLIAQGASERSEGVEGRAAYWRGRMLHQLGRVDEAIAAWRTLVQSAPLSYYGQQALMRVQELRPALGAELTAAWSNTGPIEPLRFDPRAELASPAFQRAVELLAVGEIERAREELSSMGVFGEGADPELLWLVASLFDAAQAPAQASRIARDRLRGFMAVAPRGRGAALWRIGFPRAFSPVIDDAAAEHEVPASFVRAVAREESAFDPNAVSAAGAHGLIQLMEATARQHAKGLRLPSDPSALHRPEVNVRIGASFMRYLWKRYSDNPAVVPAAYNAGHGAADRWLRERASLSLDEWIESIPYDETRRYSRRVLQSYGVYALLDEGRLPALTATLPTPRTN